LLILLICYVCVCVCTDCVEYLRENVYVACALK
jgi:hypothetical protein